MQFLDCFPDSISTFLSSILPNGQWLWHFLLRKKSIRDFIHVLSSLGHFLFLKFWIIVWFFLFLIKTTTAIPSQSFFISWFCVTWLSLCQLFASSLVLAFMWHWQCLFCVFANDCNISSFAFAQKISLNFFYEVYFFAFVRVAYT